MPSSSSSSGGGSGSDGDGGGGDGGGGTVRPILTSSQPSSPASPDTNAKKPRRSQRIKGVPIEDEEETTKATTNTTPQAPPRDADATRTPASSPPPQDNTQVASQFYYPPLVEGLDRGDDGENVWGYLWPLGGKDSEVIKLDKQAPPPSTSDKKKRGTLKTKKQLPPNGFIVGRHVECDLLIDDPVISNRHCVIFKVLANRKVPPEMTVYLGAIAY